MFVALVYALMYPLPGTTLWGPEVVPTGAVPSSYDFLKITVFGNQIPVPMVWVKTLYCRAFIIVVRSVVLAARVVLL